MKMIFFILKIGIALVLLFGLYVGGNLIYATLTDFKPVEKETLNIKNNNELIPIDSSFTFLIWNIGYGGLGNQADFFYDGGKSVISPFKDVENYIKGIRQTIHQHADKDFILIQEIDRNSKRSYFKDELDLLAAELPQHAYVYARNYLVDFIPVPYTEPMGKVDAGLGLFSRFKIIHAERLQLPGNFPWPKRVYFLDRCLLVVRTPLENGKELVVVNLHNSAYDDTGELKAAEINYLRSFLVSEYEKGNYIVVGGDWNQTPPKFDNSVFTVSGDAYQPENMKQEVMPEGWWWVYDATHPTNRNLKTAYHPQTTSCTVIDFYLVSPNLEVQWIKTHHLEFANSDHQPVELKVKIK